MKINQSLCCAAIAFALSACSDNDDKNQLDKDLRQIIKEQNISVATEQAFPVASINDAIPQLGMKLFFSKGLSGNLDTACVTCHHPMLGGGDRLSLSVGVEAEDHDLLGPGRLHKQDGHGFDGGPTVPRNAPTTFNIALYKTAIFHDGRIETVADNAFRTPDTPFGTVDLSAKNLAQAQAGFPITSVEEMRGEFQQGESNAVLRSALIQRFIGQTISNTWLEEFQHAFNSQESAETLITIDNITMAIGEYERSQLFIKNAWRDYVEGDDKALSESAKLGAKLFYQSVEDGGAGCVSCHSSEFFTDESYHVIAMPQIGRGKGNGEFGDDDFGRFRETKLESDKYAFRTPALLNVEVTFPYGHSGAYKSLTDVVKHHLDPANALATYDFSSTTIQHGMQMEHAELNSGLALQKLTALQTANTSKLKKVELDDKQVADIVEFLKSLTDPCVVNDECLSDWVPSATDSNPDNLRLVPSNSFSAVIE